jgi:hypothetical protein
MRIRVTLPLLLLLACCDGRSRLPAAADCHVELWADFNGGEDSRTIDEREFMSSAAEHRVVDDCPYANSIRQHVEQAVLLEGSATHCDDLGLVTKIEVGGQPTTVAFSDECDCMRRDGNRIYRFDPALVGLLERSLKVPLRCFSGQQAGLATAQTGVGGPDGGGAPTAACSVELWSVSQGLEKMLAEADVQAHPEEHYRTEDCRYAAEIQATVKGAHLLDNAPPSECRDYRLVARVVYQGQASLLSVGSGCGCLSLNDNTYLRFDPAVLALLVKPLSSSQRDAIYQDPVCARHLR